MKRLIKKSKHNVFNRDEALLYIDGQVLTGHNHLELISDYFCKSKDSAIKFIDEHSENNEQKNEYLDFYNKYKMLSPDLLNKYGEWSRERMDNTPVAFGHIENDDIYLDTNAIFNTDLSTVVDKLNNEYPNSNIFNDNNDQKLASNYIKYILADAAQDWVFDRAKLLREKNKDIDESESYGIAWKQYKKKHPSWKPKKKRLKK